MIYPYSCFKLYDFHLLLIDEIQIFIDIWIIKLLFITINLLFLLLIFMDFIVQNFALLV